MLVLQKKSWDAHIIQSGLADGVILDTQHLHHLLHLTEHLSQRDVLRLQLVLDLSVVSFLWSKRAKNLLQTHSLGMYSLYSTPCRIINDNLVEKKQKKQKTVARSNTGQRWENHCYFELFCYFRKNCGQLFHRQMYSHTWLTHRAISS